VSEILPAVFWLLLAYAFVWSLFVVGILFDIRQAGRRSASSQEELETMYRAWSNYDRKRGEREERQRRSLT
jgi:hypothetical protein